MDDVQALRELMIQRFDALDGRVDALTVQVRETNGRLRAAELTLATHGPEIRTLQREMGEVRRSKRARNDSGDGVSDKTPLNVYSAKLVVGIVISTATLAFTVAWFLFAHGGVR